MISVFFNFRVGYKNSFTDTKLCGKSLRSEIADQQTEIFLTEKKMTSQMLPVDFSNLFKTIMFYKISER